MRTIIFKEFVQLWQIQLMQIAEGGWRSSEKIKHREENRFGNLRCNQLNWET
jgi:hypothetical protein